jgi:hypothetical protein
VPSTPRQIARRERFEGVIGLMAPFLNGLLAAGDRLSRAVGPEDEYYPIRSAGERFSLPVKRAQPEDPAEPEPASSRSDA